MGPGFGPDELQKQVVPPPVQVGRLRDRTPEHQGAWAALGGASHGPIRRRLGTSVPWPEVWDVHGTAVVPPPPSVSGGGSLTGAGRGNRGVGLGGPLDVGVAAAPPSSNGGGSTSGVVVSSQPGSKVGLPGSGGSGALAMSPSGGDKAGLGRIGRRRRHRTWRRTRQRLLRPRLGRRQGRHRSRIRSHGARRYLALSRLRRRGHRNQRNSSPARSFGKRWQHATS